MDHNDFRCLREMLRNDCFDVEEIVLGEDNLPYDNNLQGDGEAMATHTPKRKWYQRTQ